MESNTNMVRGRVIIFGSFLLMMLLTVNALMAQMSEEAVASAGTLASLYPTEQKADTLDAPSWKPRWIPKKELFKFNIQSMVQLWSIYSTDFEVYNETTKTYERVDDRFNTSLRRARLSFSGEPYPRLKYTVMLFYDQIGRDVLSSGIGVSNRVEPSVGIWDAFFQWKVLPNSEALHVVGGWFRPQIQREAITSGWSVNSFEKSASQGYLRNHLVSTGIGRAAGIHIGGLLNHNHFGINYHVGVFNPETTGSNGNSTGKNFSPLLTSRVVLTLGDPEMTSYGISYKTNYFNERKGLSLDFNFAKQGKTDLFESSQTIGTGFLLNYGTLNLDGEWTWMERAGQVTSPEQKPRDFEVSTGTGHLRAGVNIAAGRFIIEPVAMAMHFKGAKNAEGQADAKLLNASSGSETTYDVGINWYLDRKNLKLMLHYTFREGDAGAAGDGSTVNQYFTQSGVGAIHRGNWLGIGLNTIF